jgi:hypothetical protein
MPKVDMIATKDFSYSTRRLKAGDTFEARNEADARILRAIKKARPSRVPGDAPPPPDALRDRLTQLDHDRVGAPGGSKSGGGGSEIAALRAEYKTLVGKAPFNGWNADTLREKIAAAKQK